MSKVVFVKRVRFCVQHQESYLDTCAKCAPMLLAQRQYEINLDRQREKRFRILDRSNIQPRVNGLPFFDRQYFKFIDLTGGYITPGHYWTTAAVASEHTRQQA